MIRKHFADKSPARNQESYVVAYVAYTLQRNWSFSVGHTKIVTNSLETMQLPPLHKSGFSLAFKSRKVQLSAWNVQHSPANVVTCTSMADECLSFLAGEPRFCLTWQPLNIVWPHDCRIWEPTLTLWSRDPYSYKLPGDWTWGWL